MKKGRENRKKNRKEKGGAGRSRPRTTNQTGVTINVCRGERDRATDKTNRGADRSHEFPPAPRGMPQIEVAFDMDAHGI